MFRPIFAIANATVGEAIRRKVLLIILFIATLFLIIAPNLGMLSARSETVVLKSMMLGIIQIASAVIAIVLTVYMLPNEVERRTIYTILSKPVMRWQFIAGKYLGAVLALGLMMSLMAVVMSAMFLAIKGNPAEAIRLLQAVAMYFIQMSLLASVAMCISTFVAPLVNFFLSGGLFLVGTVLSPVFDTMQKSGSSAAWGKALAQILSVILPNFATYNVQNPLINPQQQIQSEASYYINAFGYGLMYIAIMLITGMLIFEKKEV
jgi:ABC-type transport system involved in multi-copper enzyme maturation permease subunit